MKNSRVSVMVAGVMGLTVAIAGVVASPEPKMTCAEMESFLLHAHAGVRKELGVGVTHTSRVTMTDGATQHDAHVQTVNESKTTFEGGAGHLEVNFRDSYRYNIAAYELAKLLGLNMVPPYVERRVTADNGSLAWWIKDAMMESERFKKNIAIPDSESWNEQMYAVRVFHELVYDTDPNLTNLLITKDWQLWIIDLTRGFRMRTEVRNPKNLVKCDRRLLARMAELDETVLKQKLGRWLNKPEIHALDARRAIIVQMFQQAVQEKGESAVLYDFPRTAQVCGMGL